MAQTLKEILEKFAAWTITNINHGIYIPLPSPETTQAITQAVKEAVGEDERIMSIPKQITMEAFQHYVLLNERITIRNGLRAEIRANLMKFIEGEKGDE